MLQHFTPSWIASMTRRLGVTALAALLIIGCTTTTHPDGTVVQQMDPVAVQTALQVAERLYEIYEAQKPTAAEEQAEWEREQAERQARIEELRAILEALRQANVD